MVKNILITSVGRRVSLVKNFQKALKKYNKDGKVYTVDMDPFLSSACHVSDGYEKVPRVTDKNYINVLKDICLKKDISIVVPTIDTELSILASKKEEFLKDGILIAVSSKEICDTFYLKSSTEQFFRKYGFDTPSIINNLDSCKYPIFAKLDNSSCSIGAKVVYSKQEAYELKQKSKNYIFQEFIQGDEFTVDVFIDKKGYIVSVVPRKRLEVRAGEVSKAQTIKDKDIIEKVKQLSSYLTGAYGTITVQLFKTEDRIIFIEINPRFGGGYPLSWLAGADFAEYLIKDYLDISLEYNDNWKDNLIMLRYDAEVIVDGNSI